jgi:AraC-like DNA-binding protein
MIASDSRVVEVERHETPDERWEVARRVPLSPLRSLLGQTLDGWSREGAADATFYELPFPGVPLILNLDEPWTLDGTERHDSFLAGLHTQPTLVAGGRSYACVELRLTPLGAQRLLGQAMHELAGRTLALENLLPGIGPLTTRLRETRSWPQRFDLVETYLLRRLDTAPTPPPGVEWAWRELLRSGGRLPIRALAAELEWSPRRLIARFREYVGLTPKTAARVIRFDRAVALLREARTPLAEVAAECGYSDQAHLTREFRELAAAPPTRLFTAPSA